jgi:PAS domain S-box-containing protein
MQKSDDSKKEILWLKRAFDLLPDHVIITDDDGKILYANKSAEKATGFAIEEMMGKNPGKLWGGNMPKDFYEKMWRVIKDEKKAFSGSVHNKRKSGEGYWQDLHVVPVLGESEEIRFFIGVEPKISEEDARERFKQTLLSATDSQAKEPAKVIQWTLNWLVGRGELTLDRYKILESIYKNNPSMASLISDLLVVAMLTEEGDDKENGR